MPTIDQKLRVFLCHSSHDKPIVLELYQRLSAEGWIDPWLDKEKLLPGQDWDMEIQKAVETADAVIVCLSNSSVTKEGYIQKEIKKVLDISDQKPEGTIFVIPLRLEDCDPPRRLQVWQYEDYFPVERRASSYKHLLQSLKIRHTKTSSHLKQTVSHEKEENVSVVAYNQPKRGQSRQSSVYVTNISNENIYLKECVGKLTAGIYRWADGTPTYFRDMMPLPRQFAWSAKSRKDGNHSMTIGPGDAQKAILDIARTNNGDMVFTFADGDDSGNMLGIYEITLEIFGDFNGLPFQSGPKYFLLEFRGGDSLSIKEAGPQLENQDVVVPKS